MPLPPTQVVNALCESGIDFFSGIPCSFLGPLIKELQSTDLPFVIPPNEACGVAICNGAHLAGKNACLLVSAAGVTDALTTFGSCNAIFDIPFLGFVSHRGHPEIGDAPQHKLIGTIIPQLFDACGIQWETLSSDMETFRQQLARARAAMDARKTFFFVVPKGSFAPSDKAPLSLARQPRGVLRPQRRECDAPLPIRKDVMTQFAEALPAHTAVFTTTGYTSREWLEVGDRSGNFYMVGSMGTCSALGLGAALSAPQADVVVIDGDSACLMRLGTLGSVGHYRPRNYLHVLFDNQCNLSTGGQPTLSPNLDFVELAHHAGYPRAVYTHSADEFLAEYEAWRKAPCATLLYLRVSSQPSPPAPRPKSSPQELRARFAAFLAGLAPRTSLPALPAAPFAVGEEPKLFTPGPLTTTLTVKRAMLTDLGSRDPAFLDVVHGIRAGLLRAAGLLSDAYTALLMQGSGTFGVEAFFASCVPANGKVLVIANGAYGQRLIRIVRTLGIPCTEIECSDEEVPDIARIEAALTTDAAITHVAMVHCETTSGIVNPLRPVGELAHRMGRVFFVDAMSSFAGIHPLDMEADHIDFLVSSANKCVQGVPGFSFILARRDRFAECQEYTPRSHSFDLVGQAAQLDKDGQFRFTPPSHALLAFRQALEELEEEGGIPARAARYLANHRALVEGMRAIGFQPLLAKEVQGPIITTFLYPSPAFDFDAFSEAVRARGCSLYAGKVSRGQTFRVGNIGNLFLSDVARLLEAVRAAVAEMGIRF